MSHRFSNVIFCLPFVNKNSFATIWIYGAALSDGMSNIFHSQLHVLNDVHQFVNAFAYCYYYFVGPFN